MSLFHLTQQFRIDSDDPHQIDRKSFSVCLPVLFVFQPKKRLDKNQCGFVCDHLMCGFTPLTTLSFFILHPTLMMMMMAFSGLSLNSLLSNSFLFVSVQFLIGFFTRFQPSLICPFSFSSNYL